MPAMSTEKPLSVKEHIREVVLRAADEAWTLTELADALGKTPQTATTYVKQFGMEVTRSAVRHPRHRDDR